jgi:para-aminobenzoate synthetase
MKTLIIDNYDSFTFNLYQLLAEVNGAAPVVVRNDQLPWRALHDLSFDAVIVSPGPGRPERARDLGISRDALLSADVPVLGVCLGHEALGHLYGGAVVAAPEVMHGRLSEIHHDGSALFHGIPQRFAAVRYHSLVVANELPACLERLAWTADDVLMAVRHRHRPLWGVQFHPESICTEHGRRLLANFSELARRFALERRRAPVAVVAHAARAGSGAALSVVPAGSAAAAQTTAREPLVVHSRKLGFPVDAERAFVGLFGDAPRAFWLDSSDLGRAPSPSPGLSRFSFMGSAAGPHALLLRYSTDRRELTLHGAAGSTRVDESVFDYLARELEHRRVAASELPFDFNGGFVGYFGYELKAECGADRAHSSPLPDAQLLFADRLLAFDHAEQTIYLVCLAAPGDPGEAEAWLDRTEAALSTLPPLAPVLPAAAGAATLTFRPARDHDTHVAGVEECLREIRAGETYEVCLTNQLRADVALDALSFYRALRRDNPAPYAAFLRFDDLAIASSSPERFLRIERDRHVESRPIKGTARRGRTPEEDLALREALRRSEKTRAENLMIVDLLRNDLGVACEIGSVHVPRLMEVEPYATVHQLVSTVRGRLRPGLGAVDCVKLAFPGGSMTGAPKLRTMAILDRLEGAPRGVYSGAIGYLALSGAADLSIVIRTAVLDRAGVSIGVGGAVVAMSDPRAELEEALLKGEALIRAATGAAVSEPAAPSPDEGDSLPPVHDATFPAERGSVTVQGATRSSLKSTTARIDS